MLGLTAEPPAPEPVSQEVRYVYASDGVIDGAPEPAAPSPEPAPAVEPLVLEHPTEAAPLPAPSEAEVSPVMPASVPEEQAALF